MTLPIRPGDRVSARHDGQVLVGSVYRCHHGAQSLTVLTDNGMVDIPADSIVAVESFAHMVERARRGWDPAHPDEEPVTAGLHGWEWAAAATAVGVALAGAVTVTAGFIALGAHVYRWLS